MSLLKKTLIVILLLAASFSLGWYSKGLLVNIDLKLASEDAQMKGVENQNLQAQIDQYKNQIKAQEAEPKFYLSRDMMPGGNFPRLSALVVNTPSDSDFKIHSLKLLQGKQSWEPEHADLPSKAGQFTFSGGPEWECDSAATVHIAYSNFSCKSCNRIIPIAVQCSH